MTKSYTSALTGIALREGFLSSLDQEMAEFFPEFDWQNIDPRKSQITIRQILQMRSGYPWEEFSPYYNLLWSRFRNWLPLIEEIPLTSDPGTRFGYSNLMSHILGIIVARAADTSLLSFAQVYLCEPLNINLSLWYFDSLGYYYGHGDMYFTARDLARFGLLYLNEGAYNNTQIIPAEWINESLWKYSYNTYNGMILTHFGLLDYGYLWWSSGAGHYEFDFAWGHGGQLIVLLHDLNMVIVTTADYLPGESGNAAWQKEKSVLDLVGGFIAKIPLL